MYKTKGYAFYKVYPFLYMKGTDTMQTLKINDSGSLVEMLQLSLTRAGFFDSAIDGIFGPVTQRAVINFQNAFGLIADSIVGINTWDKLSRFIKGYFYKTISRGDTLWSIAAMYGTSISAIETANPDIKSNNLKLGDRIVIPFGFKLIPTNISYSSELVKNLIDGLKKRYPFITTGKIGSSTMGKDIPLIIVGKGDKNLFINAAFHANEWITIPVVLTFLEEYLNAYSKNISFSGENAKYLFDNITLHIAPLVNPDGVDLVTRALQQGEYYNNAVEISNNFDNIPFPSGWKANIIGTDLNLQFPARWEEARDIKYSQGFNRPAPRDFVGFAPLDTNEAKAVYDYTRVNDFDLILAYHTQGEVIYWKFADYLPPQSLEIAEKLSHASGYSLEITPDFAANAGYKDWFIQEYNRPGYTVEAGLGTNPLPISQFDEIYATNKPLILTTMKETINI